MTTFAPGSEAMLADLRFGFAPLPDPEPGFDPADDARALVSAGTAPLARYPILGVLVRDSLGPGQRFVLRLPAVWNGKLVVCGTPATRSEYANDAILIVEGGRLPPGAGTARVVRAPGELWRGSAEHGPLQPYGPLRRRASSRARMAR